MTKKGREAREKTQGGETGGSEELLKRSKEKLYLGEKTGLKRKEDLTNSRKRRKKVKYPQTKKASCRTGEEKSPKWVKEGISWPSSKKKTNGCYRWKGNEK